MALDIEEGMGVCLSSHSIATSTSCETVSVILRSLAESRKVDCSGYLSMTSPTLCLGVLESANASASSKGDTNTWRGGWVGSESEVRPVEAYERKINRDEVQLTSL